MTHERVSLHRDCQAIEIPSGAPKLLPSGTAVRIMNALGGSYTVSGELGGMYRIDAQDADALGMAKSASKPAATPESAQFNEALVWKELRSVYDPEIPVNVVDLGLIYSCAIAQPVPGAHRIDIKMAMTAPGCGMGDVLKSDIQTKLKRLPQVTEVSVEIVFDPPWNASRMSEAAKLQLGIDPEYDPGPSPFPMYGPKS